jgi:predicted outer membrane repeat protein
VLSGALNDDANAYHVVLMADILHYGEGDPRNTVLDGLTISGGEGAEKMKWIDFRSYTGATNNIPNGIDQQSGGGLYLVNASPVLENLRIENNRATTADPANAANQFLQGGGGIFNLARDGKTSSPRLSHVVIYNNQVMGRGLGGGMYNRATRTVPGATGATCSPVLSHVTIDMNQSSIGGGGIFSTAQITSVFCAPKISNSVISRNVGGGVYETGFTTATYTDVEFRGNIGTYGGGMIFQNNTRPVLTNATITGNLATYGGGVFNSSQNLTITNAAIFDNYAGEHGGGFYNNSLAGAVLSNVRIEDNTASSGGGIYNVMAAAGTDSNSTVLVITNGIIRNNTARYITISNPGRGGGIFNTYSATDSNANVLHLALTNVLISDNTANENGGGIYNENAVPVGTSTPGEGIIMLLNNVTIANNTAAGIRTTGDGGGIYIPAENDSTNPTNKITIRANNSIIWGNTAQTAAYNNIYNPTASWLSLYTSLAQDGDYTDGDALTYPNKTAGNFSNSLFTDFAGKDYTLNAGVSGLIDGGANNLYPADADALLAGSLGTTGTRYTNFKALISGGTVTLNGTHTVEGAVFGGSRPIDRDAPPATGTDTASHGARIKDGDGDSDGDGDPDAIIDLGAYEK